MHCTVAPHPRSTAHRRQAGGLAIDVNRGCLPPTERCSSNKRVPEVRTPSPHSTAHRRQAGGLTTDVNRGCSPPPERCSSNKRAPEVRTPSPHSTAGRKQAGGLTIDVCRGCLPPPGTAPIHYTTPEWVVHGHGRTPTPLCDHLRGRSLYDTTFRGRQAPPANINGRASGPQPPAPFRLTLHSSHTPQHGTQKAGRRYAHPHPTARHTEGRPEA